MFGMGGVQAMSGMAVTGQKGESGQMMRSLGVRVGCLRALTSWCFVNFLGRWEVQIRRTLVRKGL